MSGWKGGTLGAYSLLSLPRGFTGREQHLILASLGWFQAAVSAQVTALGAPTHPPREQCPAVQSCRVDSSGKRRWFICCLFVLLDLEPASTSCLSLDLAVLSFEGFNHKALSGWCPSQGQLAPREGPRHPEACRSYCHRFQPQVFTLPSPWFSPACG